MNLLDRIVRLNQLIVTVIFIIVIGIIVPFNLIGFSLPEREIALPSIAVQLSARANIDHLKKARVAGAYTYVPPTATTIPTLEPSPTPIPIGKPISIEIAKISLAAEITPIGLTDNHSMDIPKDFFTTGWYERSVKPGEEGSAIINGHFDTSSGAPAVFYKLGDLVRGDEINIETDLQQKLTFIVDESFTHPLEDFPADIVYKNEPGRILKLITCDGIWDPVKKIYSSRRVITAHLREKTGVEVGPN